MFFKYFKYFFYNLNKKFIYLRKRELFFQKLIKIQKKKIFMNQKEKIIYPFTKRDETSLKSFFKITCNYY